MSVSGNLSIILFNDRTRLSLKGLSYNDNYFLTFYCKRNFNIYNPLIMLIFVYLLADFYLLPSDIKVILFCHKVSPFLFLSACFQAKKGGLLHIGIRSPLKRKKLDLPLILFNWLVKCLRKHKSIKNVGKRSVYYILLCFQ